MMLLERLPTEVQALVCGYLGPYDLHALLLATDKHFHHLLAHFSDTEESSFFDFATNIPQQNLHSLSTAHPAAINVIEISSWALLDTDQLLSFFLNRHNVIIITLDASPEEADSTDCYENLGLFLRSFLPSSHILLQGLVSGITLNESDIAAPSHLTIAHSQDVHIYAPDSSPESGAISHHSIQNLSIESYSAHYLENFCFQNSPTNSLHLDSIEPYTISNTTICAPSVAIEGVKSIHNITFTGTDVTFIAHAHLTTDPNSKQPVSSLMENIVAPNLETAAFFFYSVFPRINNIHAPRLRHACFFSRTPHDITLADITPNIDAHVDSNFSYLENLISIEVSIFDAPLLQCPRFNHLQYLSLELVRPLITSHIFPSLKRLSLTLLGPYQGSIPDINAPLVQQYALTVHRTSLSVSIEDLACTLKRLRPLTRLTLEIHILITECLRTKINHYLESRSSELKSLKLIGLPLFDVFSNKRSMMPCLTDLNIQGSYDKLSVSFYAPELRSLTIKTHEKFSRVKVRGFPKLKDIKIRSHVDSLSLTRAPQVESVFVGGVLHSFKADYLPVVKELMYTMPRGGTVETVELVDYINPKIHRAELHDGDIWLDQP